MRGRSDRAAGGLVNENLDRVHAGLRPPALRRYGETDDRWVELI